LREEIFSGGNLQAIACLWGKSSNGQFGFSIQKGIERVLDKDIVKNSIEKGGRV
jgi:hypothetical protein